MFFIALVNKAFFEKAEIQFKLCFFQLSRLETGDGVKKTISLELVISVFCFGFSNADHNL